MAFFRVRGIDRARGIKIDIAGRPQRIARAENGFDNSGGRLGTHNGFVDAVSRVVHQIADQQKLGKRVVFAKDTVRQIAFGNAEQRREEIGAVMALVVAKIFFERQLCQVKCHVIDAPPLEIVERVVA